MTLDFFQSKSFKVFKKVSLWIDIQVKNPAFTCSKSTMEKPEQCMKSVQS